MFCAPSNMASKCGTNPRSLCTTRRSIQLTGCEEYRIRSPWAPVMS